ncbi:MAG: integrin alpha [Myxococcota bacterium]|nr:integrin alpha [Myxococcota bacterium]
MRRIVSVLGCSALLWGCQGSKDGPRETADETGAVHYTGWPSGEVRQGEADVVLLGIDDGDQTGQKVDPAGDIDGDGLADLLIAADIHTAGTEKSGAAFLVYGADLRPEYSLSEASVTFFGEGELDHAGHGLAGLGDLDADGRGELVVAGYQNSLSGLERGRLYVYRGTDLLEDGERSLSDAPIILEGVDDLDRLGHRVETAGDVDGDGIPDLVTGAYGARHQGDKVGAAYLVKGTELLVEGVRSIEEASHAVLFGESNQDEAGFYVTGAGDLDGDGRDDLVVAAPRADASYSNNGVVYVVLAAEIQDGGEFELPLSGGTIRGEGASDECCGLAEVGDVDGDGRSEVIFGAPLFDDTEFWAGRSYLFSAVTLTAGGSRSVSEADWVLSNDQRGELVGSSVAGVGDLNLDGLSDFLVGVPGASQDHESGGAAGLFFGWGASSVERATLSDADVRFYGEQAQGFWGRCVTAVGDANGDGLEDLAFGAPVNPQHALDGPGSVYLFYTP